MLHNVVFSTGSTSLSDGVRMEQNFGTIHVHLDQQASYSSTENRQSATASFNASHLSDGAMTQTGNRWLMTSSGDDVATSDVTQSRGHYGGRHSFSISRL